MSEFEAKAVDHLKTLAKACREFLKKGSYNKMSPYFTKLDMELVRAEDFLEGVVGDADLRI